MDIVIKPLSAETCSDFLRFFDIDAFSDNPDWADCYCRFYNYADNAEWEKLTGEQNRAEAEAAIKSGTMNGYLAYLDGEPVGWVNSNDRKNLARLCANMELPEGDKILSVVCFTVSPKHRRLGIARSLLESVIQGAAGRYDYIEAYPIKNGFTDAFCYHGPFSMYENAGFETVKEFQGYWVVRKKV